MASAAKGKSPATLLARMDAAPSAPNATGVRARSNRGSNATAARAKVANAAAGTSVRQSRESICQNGVSKRKDAARAPAATEPARAHQRNTAAIPAAPANKAGRRTTNRLSPSILIDRAVSQISRGGLK